MTIQNSELENYLCQLLKADYSSFENSPIEAPAIRVNTLKTTVARFEEKLSKWQVDYRPHPINPTGFILKDDKLPLSHTLSFFLGDFFYQGIASQLPVLALDPQPGETILDMSAAPGSKATQIAALMNNSGRLVLNDPSPGRNAILIRHAHRAGILNDVVLRVPGQQIGQLFPDFFDRILVDAPCTGLGTFVAKPDEIKQWWSYHKLKKLSEIQYYLLISAVKAAKVGGTIVYSTCSIAPEENEQVIQKILKDYPVEIETLPGWTGFQFQHGMQKYQNHTFHPDLQKAVRISPMAQPIEGFFIVRLKKVAATRPGKMEKQMTYQATRRCEDDDVAPVIAQIEQRWGLAAELLSPYRFMVGAKRIWMVHPQWETVPEKSMVKVGMVLAEKKLNDWKLTNSSIQMFKSHITKGLLSIEAHDLINLFQSGQLAFPGYAENYYVLNFRGENIGSVSLFGGRLKIDIPHQFDLVL